MYNLFNVLHVFFAAMTIALLPFSLLMMKRIKRSAGTPVELTSMMILGYIGKTMGMMGGIGLLLMGGAMTGVAKFPWFNFQEFPWLAWKQVIFFTILAINFAVVVPASKKIGKLIAERMSTGGVGGATDEIRAIGSKIGVFTMIMNILTLIAMTLGVTKGIF